MSRVPPTENREQRRAEIVRSALVLLDESGMDGLSLRALAQALGMHAPGLYWYIRDKQELIDLLAEAIMIEAVGHQIAPVGDQRWDAWLEALAEGTWQALFAHRDGARIIAGARMLRTDIMPALMESSIVVLEREGLVAGESLSAVSTVLRYTMGLALDEQLSPPVEMMRDRAPDGDASTDASTRPRLSIDATKYPRLAELAQRWVNGMYASRREHTDAHFRRGLGLILDGIRGRVQTSTTA